MVFGLVLLDDRDILADFLPATKINFFEYVRALSCGSWLKAELLRFGFQCLCCDITASDESAFCRIYRVQSIFTKTLHVLHLLNPFNTCPSLNLFHIKEKNLLPFVGRYPITILDGLPDMVGLRANTTTSPQVLLSPYRTDDS